MNARIVFDLDGTLIDSAPDIQGVANAVLSEYNRPPITLADTKSFIGQGVAVFVARLSSARNLPQADHAALLEAFLTRYEGAVGLTHTYPGVRAMLATLAPTNRLGICTNKPLTPTLAVIEHLNLRPHFQAIRGGDDPSGRKPDPAPLLATFGDLGTGPMIYVGDSETDAETAKRAGVPFFLFSGGYRKNPVQDLPHTAVFDNFDALPGLISNHLASN